MTLLNSILSFTWPSFGARAPFGGIGTDRSPGEMPARGEWWPVGVWLSLCIWQAPWNAPWNAPWCCVSVCAVSPVSAQRRPACACCSNVFSIESVFKSASCTLDASTEPYVTSCSYLNRCILVWFLQGSFTFGWFACLFMHLPLIIMFHVLLHMHLHFHA